MKIVRRATKIDRKIKEITFVNKGAKIVIKAMKIVRKVTNIDRKAKDIKLSTKGRRLSLRQ